MSRSILTDLRFGAAPFEAQAAYLLLLARADELPEALDAVAPEAVVGAVTRTPPRRARAILGRLRAAGLVSREGLELLVQPRRRTRRGAGATATPGVGPGVDDAQDALRDALRACGRPLAEVARASGIDRASLSLFAAGRCGLGEARRARLLAALPTNATNVGTNDTNVGTNDTNVGTNDTNGDTNGDTNVGTNVGTNTPSAPPASPASLPSPPTPPSDSPSDPSNPLTTPASSARAGEAQGEARAQQTSAPATPAAPLTPKRGPKPRPEPRPDPVPESGLARRIYDALVGDPALAPITAGPGDLATRLALDGAYPGLDGAAVLAAVRAAGTYAAGRPGQYRDGRRYLTGWLQRESERAASRPRPVAPVAARTAHRTVDDLVAEGLRRRAEKAERLAREAQQQQQQPLEAGGM